MYKLEVDIEPIKVYSDRRKIIKDIIYIGYIYIYEFILSGFSAETKIMNKLHENDKRKKIVLDRIKSRNNIIYKAIIALVIIFYVIYIFFSL
ncbi:hypothetical protein R2F61_03840 [Mollicutes bacterium LVI A0078]|nr:hypothetical protein R2F61_03840 [Mollicutes bacterium LVI A0078]